MNQGGNGFAGDCHWQAKRLTGSKMAISRVLGNYRP